MAFGLVWLGVSPSAVAGTAVATWEFNQDAGVVRDLSGANHLTLSGPWSSVPGGPNHPSAIRFEAVPATAATTTAAGANFNPGAGSFALTVQLRVSKDVTFGSPNVAQRGLFNDPGQIKMQIAASGKIGCRIKGNRAAYLIYHQTTNMNDNQWHTVTCSRDSTGITVTVDDDGFSPGGTENPGTITANNLPFRFAQKTGSSTSRDDQFVGDISFASFSL